MRHVGSDPQAERGRGEVKLSPISGLTLQPMVGGFYEALRLLGCPVTNEVKRPGGSAREGTYASFYARGSEVRLKGI